MKIAVIGLGLIGGSLAKTLRARTAHGLYGADTDPQVLHQALESGVLDGEATPAVLMQCDVVVLALFPAAGVAWLRQYAERLSSQTVVVDCGGIKSLVCQAGFELAQQYGFTFIGGHPMAGSEHSGWAAARDGLFDNASMILVPPCKETAETQEKKTAQNTLQPDTVLEKVVPSARLGLETLQKLFLSLGFGRITLTDAAHHDRIIAYTSQLAHVVSNAYIKSPAAQGYAGFSAGSFKDMTRVAFLNETMWTELFLENRQPLLSELDFLMERLAEYRRALQDENAEELCRLLAQGKELKLRSDECGKTPAEPKSPAVLPPNGTKEHL